MAVWHGRLHKQELHRNNAAAKLLHTASALLLTIQHAANTRVCMGSLVRRIFASCTTCTSSSTTAVACRRIHLQGILQCLHSRLFRCGGAVPAWWRLHRPDMVISSQAPQRQVSCPASTGAAPVLHMHTGLQLLQAVMCVGPVCC